MSRRARGFTLIELMVVVAIIAALIGLLVPAMSVLKNRQKQAQARTQVMGLALAVQNYLGDYGILGEELAENPTDFAAAPAHFLIARPRRSNRDVYLQVKTSEITDDALQPVPEVDARQLINPWGKRIRFTITNARSGPTTGFDHTKTIVIRSGPTGADIPNELIYSYDLDQDAWQWAK